VDRSFPSLEHHKPNVINNLAYCLNTYGPAQNGAKTAITPGASITCGARAATVVAPDAVSEPSMYSGHLVPGPRTPGCPTTGVTSTRTPLLQCFQLALPPSPARPQPGEAHKLPQGALLSFAERQNGRSGVE